MHFHIVADTDAEEGIGIWHARSVDDHGWDFVTLALLFGTLEDLLHEVPEVLADGGTGLDLDHHAIGLQVEPALPGDGNASGVQEFSDAALNPLPAQSTSPFLPARLEAYLKGVL